MNFRIIPLLCAAGLLLSGCSSESSALPDEPLRTDASQTETAAETEPPADDGSSFDSALLHEEKSSEIPAEAVTLRTGVTISDGETVEIAKDYLNDHGDPVLVLVSIRDGNYMPLTNAEYKYDKAGRMIWKHENTITNDYVNYTYDANGKLVTEEFYASDFHPHRIEYSYDQYGNLLRKVTVYTGEDDVAGRAGMEHMAGIAEDGAEQDVYILGTDQPLREFEGKVIAVYRRFDDVEDKWIVSLDGKDYPDGVILEAIHFQHMAGLKRLPRDDCGGIRTGPDAPRAGRKKPVFGGLPDGNVRGGLQVMIWIIRSLLCRLLFGKGGELMMAMLWAQRIMSAPTLEEAHALWYRVPRLLKEKVREILIESGCEDLIPDED